MFENPRRGRQARNFTTNVPKILVLKSSSEQIFSRKLPLGAPEYFIWVLIPAGTSQGTSTVFQSTHTPPPAQKSNGWPLIRHSCLVVGNARSYLISTGVLLKFRCSMPPLYFNARNNI